MSRESQEQHAMNKHDRSESELQAYRNTLAKYAAFEVAAGKTFNSPEEVTEYVKVSKTVMEKICSHPDVADSVNAAFGGVCDYMNNHGHADL